MNNNLHEIKEEIYKYYKLIEKIQIQEITNYNNYYVEYYF